LTRQVTLLPGYDAFDRGGTATKPVAEFASPSFPAQAKEKRPLSNARKEDRESLEATTVQRMPKGEATTIQEMQKDK
jgi:hypothetical protein